MEEIINNPLIEIICMIDFVIIIGIIICYIFWLASNKSNKQKDNLIIDEDEINDVDNFYDNELAKKIIKKKLNYKRLYIMIIAVWILLGTLGLNYIFLKNDINKSGMKYYIYGIIYVVFYFIIKYINNIINQHDIELDNLITKNILSDFNEINYEIKNKVQLFEIQKFSELFKKMNFYLDRERKSDISLLEYWNGVYKKYPVKVINIKEIVHSRNFYHGFKRYNHLAFCIETNNYVDNWISIKSRNLIENTKKNNELYKISNVYENLAIASGDENMIDAICNKKLLGTISRFIENYGFKLEIIIFENSISFRIEYEYGTEKLSSYFIKKHKYLFYLFKALSDLVCEVIDIIDDENNNEKI